MQAFFHQIPVKSFILIETIFRKKTLSFDTRADVIFTADNVFHHNEACFVCDKNYNRDTVNVVCRICQIYITSKSLRTYWFLLLFYVLLEQKINASTISWNKKNREPFVTFLESEISVLKWNSIPSRVLSWFLQKKHIADYTNITNGTFEK